ncbi:lipopolysaccharide biosynthesis protein [Enterococcus devriesei]|uniref:lipopolysaccharide biosynthesis protein n=1 Tax=Enterococcus devriesei TaxID=319970 RepID=UPI0036D254F2
MNNKTKSITTNMRYAVTANFAILAVGVILNLFVPKVINVTDFGYWQIYTFYSSFALFLNIGWLDGIYLRFGGEEYEDLNKEIFGTQFWLLLLFQVTISILLIILANLFVSSPDKKTVLVLVSVTSLILNLKFFIIYLFQTTNRIKDYSLISQNDRYIYIFFLLGYFFCGGRSYVMLIIFDIIANVIVTCWGMLRIKDIIFKPLKISSNVLLEVRENISVGINLMISNIASKLMVGVSRIIVENNWDVDTFGKLSLTLSISNMFLTFVNAIGIVIFPVLRKTDRSNMKKIYTEIRPFFVFITYVLLLSFIPIKFVLGVWLPNYRESLNFMILLFPMIVYEGRMSLLVSTYLKVLREERTILAVNLISLVVALFSSLISAYFLQNLNLTVASILIVIMVRCILAENRLIKKMNMNIRNENIFETLLTLLFIISNIFFNNVIAFIVYLVCITVFFVQKKENILKGVKNFSAFVKTKK